MPSPSPGDLPNPGIGPTSPTQPEKAMTPHSTTLAWRIPWTEEAGGLQSIASQRVRHE